MNEDLFMDKEIPISHILETRARDFCATLGVDIDTNWFVVAAGLSAIAESFHIRPDTFGLDSIFFSDLKPSFLHEIDGVEMVLSIEKKTGRFMDPNSARLLAQIYRKSVADWLKLLIKSKWK